MTLYQKSKQVEKLFATLAPQISKLSSSTGLSCFSGCGKCCANPKVEATILEFLPFAMHCFLTGKAEAVLAEVSALGDAPCHLYSATSLDGSSGFCGSYNYRGLICRLFGFSARRKENLLQLYTCSRMKAEAPATMDRVKQRLTEKPDEIPVVSDYYRKLKNIDPTLGAEMMQINKAQQEALKLVLHYYSYRPKSRRKAA